MIYMSHKDAKISLFLEERNGSSLSSPFVRSNYEWALLHVGIGGKELLGLNYYKWQCLLPKVWIKSLWEFVHKCEITFPCGSCDLKLTRLGDKFLMQWFSDFGESKRQLLRLNRCRLFLQVITLAEISDGSRDKITMSITSDEQLALIGDAAEYRQVEHSECIQLTLCSSN